MAKATLIVHERRLDASGGITEIKVWRVPNPVQPSTHGYKYSLFYGRPGTRLVGATMSRAKATTCTFPEWNDRIRSRALISY